MDNELEKLLGMLENSKKKESVKNEFNAFCELLGQVKEQNSVEEDELDNFWELIERAKELSKKRILEFAKGIYDIDEEVLDYMWKVPIISNYDSESIISTELSTKSKDDIIDILDTVIQEEKGTSKAAFIPFDRMASLFESEEKEEYQNKLENNEITEDYDCFIVYDESKLEEEYNEYNEDNKKMNHSLTQQEVDNIFVKYIAEVFTHERCHLNADFYFWNFYNFKGQSVNGIFEQNEELKDSEGFGDSLEELRWKGRNEVLIDTLNLMINKYEKGDGVQDCLYKVIKERNGEHKYKNEALPIDEEMVLAMYILFPEELTQWVMFGAMEERRVNLFKEKMEQVIGQRSPNSTQELMYNINKYCEGLETNKLSEKQVKMLEMLEGEKTNLRRVRSEMQVATSSLAGSLLDVGAFTENISNKEDEER